MSDLNKNLRDPDLSRPVGPREAATGSWVAGVVVAILAIIALGYFFGDRILGNSSVLEHRAAATDTALPPPAPALTPAAAPTQPPKP